MATRYQAAVASLGLALAGATGGVIYSAATSHEARGTLGVSADPTTAQGDTVYRASALPDAGLQRLAIGADASVLTSINGVPTWRAASGGITTPTTLAGQQRLDTTLRRGPLATLGQSSGVGWYASTTASAAIPDIRRGTSGVTAVYSTQAGSYATAGYLVTRGSWGVRGFVLMAFGNDLRIYPQNASGTTYVTLANAVASVGWHSVAWSISSDGATVRASVDGGGAASQTITSGPLAFVAPLTSDSPRVLFDGASGGSQIPVAYAALWTSVLSDADLALLSADPSEGAADIAAISGGAPAWEWAAAPLLGLARTTIAGDTWVVTSTAPQVWMP